MGKVETSAGLIARFPIIVRSDLETNDSTFVTCLSYPDIVISRSLSRKRPLFGSAQVQPFLSATTATTMMLAAAAAAIAKVISASLWLAVCCSHQPTRVEEFH
jgi:hypothetical protein